MPSAILVVDGDEAGRVPQVHAATVSHKPAGQAQLAPRIGISAITGHRAVVVFRCTPTLLRRLGPEADPAPARSYDLHRSPTDGHRQGPAGIPVFRIMVPCRL